MHASGSAEFRRDIFKAKLVLTMWTHTHIPVRLCLVLCGLWHLQLSAATLVSCRGVQHPYWQELNAALFTKNTTVERYRTAVEPLATMTKLSYTGKHGTESVEGFELLANMTPSIGLNVLAYRGNAAQMDKLVVVAFRGTTTLSDRCM